MIFLSVNFPLHIMMPKCRLIWSGEVIHVSNLLVDDHRRRSGKNSFTSEISSVTFGDSRGTSFAGTSFAGNTRGSGDGTYGNHRDSIRSDQRGSKFGDRSTDVVCVKNRRKQNRLRPVLLSDVKPVPRIFLGKLLNTQQILNHVSQRSMNGKLISRSDWQKLKIRGASFGVFCENLKFSWEDRPLSNDNAEPELLDDEDDEKLAVSFALRKASSELMPNDSDNIHDIENLNHRNVVEQIGPLAPRGHEIEVDLPLPADNASSDNYDSDDDCIMDEFDGSGSLEIVLPPSMPDAISDAEVTFQRRISMNYKDINIRTEGVFIESDISE